MFTNTEERKFGRRKCREENTDTPRVGPGYKFQTFRNQQQSPETQAFFGDAINFRRLHVDSDRAVASAVPKIVVHFMIHSDA